MNVKTRFAPSPTGLIHFGNVRTALFNWLFAQRQNGQFLLRIEDTDLERSRDEYVQALMGDLEWLGLGWDEGETKKGVLGPYRQSQRTVVYESYLHELEKRDHAYPCFCSVAELEISRKLQAQAGKPPRYSGKCAHLSADEAAQKKAAGQAYTLRFRMPRNAVLEFSDLVRGPQRCISEDIGDFIIRRSDGTFAFFFVNAIDDALMQVTHVLRGEDHLTNTPRQIALLKTLGLSVPSYGHISLIVNDKGAPLSKRSGSMSIEDLRKQGYFPLAINNYLARLGHHYEGEHLLDMAQLAQGFKLESLGRAPARYERSQLDHWQALALHRATDDELWSWMSEVVGDRVSDKDAAAFVPVVRHNILFPVDALVWAHALFNDFPDYSNEAIQVIEKTDRNFFSRASSLIDQGMDFPLFAQQVKSATGCSGKSLFMPLRAALTGNVHGPEMPGFFKLLGFDRAKARLMRLS
ncbi:MAG: glutamate--tRNA ligase [Proteobacteria bacterium]|nr:glutamate--tRNA ligase [Pseudomonadota bacterium]